MQAESVRLPGGEPMGLLTTSMSWQVSEHDWLGPAIVGAATGHRGGLFVLGGVWQHDQPWGDNWALQTTLLAGGGGGAAAPVGSGLLIEPSMALLRRFGNWRLGLTGSRAMFADGRIHSNQFGLLVQWDGSTRTYDVNDVGAVVPTPSNQTGFGVDRVMPTLSRYSIRKPGGVRQSVKLVGARAEQRWDHGWYGGMETAAATHGGADGYMEILGVLGWRTPMLPAVTDRLQWGAKIAAGLGGGGAIRTGGGAIAKAGGTFDWDLTPTLSLGAEAGWASSLRSHLGQGPFKASYVQAYAGWRFDGLAVHPVEGMDWSACLEHLAHAQRKDGSRASLDTVGIKANLWVSQNGYLTGQAHSAFAGQAGAYSVGLLGVGWTHRPGSEYWAKPFTYGVEALMGAAGGGGVKTQGGAIAQGMLSVGYQWSRRTQLQVGVGKVRSLRSGGLNSPVVDLSWTVSLGV
ncbi:MAG TPA: hypothetical protein VFM48_15070 [Aquabacterium sp.]|nr:hypothetical protein [Aquabacterium sp.]